MAFFLDDKQIYLDRPFVGEDGVQYPSNWLRLATPEEREAVNIVERQEPVKASPVKAKKTEEYDLEDKKLKRGNKEIKGPDGKPVIVKGKKTVAIEQERRSMLTLLANTDWYVIRYVETQEGVPAEIKAYRDEVRQVYELRCIKIAECSEAESFRLLFLRNSEGALPPYPQNEVTRL